MFRLAVILVHTLVFILVTIVALAGKYNPASPDPEETYGVWFSIFVIFNLLVLVSAVVQLKIKKVWVFVLSILGLMLLLILTLQYVYPLFMELF